MHITSRSGVKAWRTVVQPEPANIECMNQLLLRMSKALKACLLPAAVEVSPLRLIDFCSTRTQQWKTHPSSHCAQNHSVSAWLDGRAFSIDIRVLRPLMWSAQRVVCSIVQLTTMLCFDVSRQGRVRSLSQSQQTIGLYWRPALGPNPYKTLDKFLLLPACFLQKQSAILLHSHRNSWDMFLLHLWATNLNLNLWKVGNNHAVVVSLAVKTTITRCDRQSPACDVPLSGAGRIAQEHIVTSPPTQWIWWRHWWHFVCLIFSIRNREIAVWPCLNYGSKQYDLQQTQDKGNPKQSNHSYVGAWRSGSKVEVVILQCEYDSRVRDSVCVYCCSPVWGHSEI
jgi:hypothetical protein